MTEAELSGPSRMISADSGKSEVNVTIGSQPNAVAPGSDPKSNFLRDNWPMFAFLIGAIFSAGVLWNKVDQLEKSQDSFKAEIRSALRDINGKLGR